MSFIHALIIGNLIMVMVNLLGMAGNFRLPPLWAYVIGWIGVIFVVYGVGNL